MIGDLEISKIMLNNHIYGFALQRIGFYTFIV